MDLTQKHCVPCEGGTPPMNIEEVQKYLSEVSGWIVVDGNKRINKKFKFKNFVEAIKFMNKVAEIAEQEQHHPNIHIFYSIVELELWTHAIAGLSENDFILASKVDKIQNL